MFAWYTIIVELEKGEKSGNDKGWVSAKEVWDYLEKHYIIYW